MMPVWATTVFSVQQWKEILDQHGVDESAQHELFLLAQFNAEGACHANQCIAVLIKKVSDSFSWWNGGQTGLGNPSAFVHANVRKARHFLTGKYGVTLP
jgi:hypothetical protein